MAAHAPHNEDFRDRSGHRRSGEGRHNFSSHSDIPRGWNESSRRSPPHLSRREALHDRQRTPPRGPANDYSYNRYASSSRRGNDDLSSEYNHRGHLRSFNDRHDRHDRRDRYDHREHHDRGRYRDWDREERRSSHRSPRSPSRGRGRDRGRSRSPRAADRSPNFGGSPSREIMLDGLEQDITEQDVQSELVLRYNVQNLEDIRIIKDKATAISKGYAFIRFPTLDDATSFMNANYPEIRIESSNSTNDTQWVRIAYSRERSDRESYAEWTCRFCPTSNRAWRTECYSCRAPRLDKPSTTNTGAPAEMQDGYGDQSETAVTPVLVIRGLEPNVNESVLAKGVQKLFKSTSNATNGTPKNTTTKLTSTTNPANLGAKDGSLHRVLLIRDKRSDTSWRFGFAEFFSIQDAEAAMAKYKVLDNFTISSKPVTISFAHAGVFTPPIPGTLEMHTFPASIDPTRRLAYRDTQAYAKEYVVEAVSLQSKNLPPVSAVTPNIQNGPQGQGQLPGEKLKISLKKRKRDPTNEGSSKKIPSQFQQWNDRQMELYGPSESNSASAPAPAGQATPLRTAGSLGGAPSFIDREKRCCYLCERRFKNEQTLLAHERKSDLHLANLQKPDLKAKAMTKLQQTAEITTGPEYRDRAKERRQQQSKSPAPTTTSTSSIGQTLLAKMGWSAGQGLGAQGTGRVAAIETQMYAQGVGLGAQGGKIGDAAHEANKNTHRDEYRAYVDMVKEKAKERYNSMN